MRAWKCCVILSLALVPSRPRDAAAQIPETFTNLELLGEDVSRDSLVRVMRGFALGLGVRCHYCHVGEEGLPFSEWDFASDEKPEKRKARFMLRMVRYLNEERLPELPAQADAERRSPDVRLTCETCHRGAPVPRAIEEEVAVKLAESGADAAVSHYRALRERYYGAGTYDFGPRRLAELGQGLVAEGRTSDAVPLLELNLEYHPESVQTLVVLGAAYVTVDRKADAIEALERALALAPGDPEITRRLEEVRR